MRLLLGAMAAAAEGVGVQVRKHNAWRAAARRQRLLSGVPVVAERPGRAAGRQAGGTSVSALAHAFSVAGRVRCAWHDRSLGLADVTR